MDERLKRRLIGATVLAALMVIFVPMLLEDRPVEFGPQDGSRIPSPPPDDEAFSSANILPLQDEPLSEPPPLPEQPERADQAPDPVRGIPSHPVAEAEPVSPAELEPTAGDATPVDTQPTPEPAAEAAPEPPSAAAKPAPRVGIKAWAVQVASFSNQQNAEKLLQRLRAAKFPAFIEFAAVNGKSVYRVRIGPEVDRKRAEQMAEEIRKQHALQANVVRYP